jgi:hypothetical protein
MASPSVEMVTCSRDGWSMFGLAWSIVNREMLLEMKNVGPSALSAQADCPSSRRDNAMRESRAACDHDT